MLELVRLLPCLKEAGDCLSELSCGFRAGLLGIEIVLHLFVEDVLLQFVARVGKDHSVFIFQNIAQLQALDV